MVSRIIFFFALAISIQNIASQYLAAPCNGFIPDGLPFYPDGLALEVPYAAGPNCYATNLVRPPVPCPLTGADMIGLPRAFSPSFGGSFPISSSSPVLPTGISVTSENAYDGRLSVAGQLPFLSAVVVEGTVPSHGDGAVLYGCGCGEIAILNEDVAPLYPGYGRNGFIPGLGYPY